MPDTTTTLTGKVTRINPKGYAFIVPSGTSADISRSGIFFHRSAMIGNAFDLLQEGDSVTYTEVASDKGPRAESVRPL
jgi:cold shock CspA family protein